ncbi:MAG: tetratricopeptide repeat protein [Chitinophagales bacterium]|nr:tetratricopeptide repeat protein [Chitinophagales bacterium]
MANPSENIQEQLAYYESIILKSTDAKERVHAIGRYGTICLTNRMHVNLEWSKEGLELARQLKYHDGIRNCASVCGYYYAVHGDFATSQEYFFEALEAGKHSDNITDYSAMLGNIAANFEQMGSFEQSINYVKQAIEINEKHNAKHLLVRNLAVMANVYYALEQYDKSKEYFEKATILAKELNNQSAVAMYVGNIGHVEHAQKNYQSAINHFSEALAINESLNLDMGIANNNGSLGKAYHELQEYDHAFAHLERAIEISKRTNVKASASNHLCELGSIYADANSGYFDSEKAEQLLLEALAYAQSTDSKSVLLKPLQTLSKFYRQTKNWEKFAEYIDKAHETEKEVRNAESIKAATGYEVQKKLATEEGARKATEKILHNILPQSIAERIKNGEEKIIQKFDNASVLFADMVGFTKWSEQHTVDEVAETLNQLFNLFDELATEHGVEKIKTIGDAYMCVAGLPEPCFDHAERIALMAIAMLQKVKENFPNGEIKLRIGIHSGEVIAGVLGKNKYAYDLWGDTVNTASRMESHGAENKIQVSDIFKNLLSDKFTFEERGEIELKGKGKMKTWFLIAEETL